MLYIWTLTCVVEGEGDTTSRVLLQEIGHSAEEARRNMLRKWQQYEVNQVLATPTVGSTTVADFDKPGVVRSVTVLTDPKADTWQSVNSMEDAIGAAFLQSNYGKTVFISADDDPYVEEDAQ